VARTLGHELKKARQLRGLSLSATAKPAGVSATYLQKLERDEVESPSPHRLNRLAAVLGVEYAELFRLAGYELPGDEAASGDAANTATREEAKSLVRRMFLSEDCVSDEEIAELIRYLTFIREERSAD